MHKRILYAGAAVVTLLAGCQTSKPAATAATASTAVGPVVEAGSEGVHRDLVLVDSALHADTWPVAAVASLIAPLAGGWLARRVSANTDLLVYFAGHGAPDASRSGPYLLPFDADAA